MPVTKAVLRAPGGAAIVDAAIRAFDRIDILIYNAGFLRNAAFEALNDEHIQSIIDVYLMAGFYVGQPVFAVMKKQGCGRILLTSLKDIGRHLAQIDDVSCFDIPSSMFDEFTPIVAARKSQLKR